MKVLFPRFSQKSYTNNNADKKAFLNVSIKKTKTKPPQNKKGLHQEFVPKIKEQ